MLSRHFGWPGGFASTPYARGKSAMSYSSDIWEPENIDEEASTRDIVATPRFSPLRHLGPPMRIGEIAYFDGALAQITVPVESVGSTYDVIIVGQQQVDGLHIPSHRATYVYQQVQSIPTVPRRRNDVFQHYSNLIRSRYMGQHVQWSPHYYMKETLIALATFGEGNSAVEADEESRILLLDFQEVLRRMLPAKLGFRRLIIRVPEVVLETTSGTFSLDALSGGAAAVLDLAWQIFMFKPSGASFVVTLDEPENHLHPELQRRVLSDLLAAFPSAQFVVATHSPFIVGSVADSNVYVLDYDEGGRVFASLLDTVNKGGSANEILRDVLGLQFTMPVWVESRLAALVNEFSEKEFTNATLAELRTQMNGLGLGRLIPETIAQLAERKEKT